jgi:hypothetical protein
MHVVRAFPAFAVSFAMLFQVWWRQYRFFRKFDLEDSYVIVVTGILLFVVLFYVYPLKSSVSVSRCLCGLSLPAPPVHLSVSISVSQRQNEIRNASCPTRGTYALPVFCAGVPKSAVVAAFVALSVVL